MIEQHKRLAGFPSAARRIPCGASKGLGQGHALFHPWDDGSRLVPALGSAGKGQVRSTAAQHD